MRSVWRWKRGKLLTSRPRRKRMTARRKVWRRRDFRVAPLARRASVEKTVEMPTTKRKVGKTRSVGVKPFQAVCFMAQ